MSKVYMVYKTINMINNRFYIGVHGTFDILDEYLGSGKILKRSIAKYGKENFRREILFVFDTSYEAFEKEKELITEDLIESGECYNLKIGGSGGWDFFEKYLISCGITRMEFNKNVSPFGKGFRETLNQSQLDKIDKGNLRGLVRAREQRMINHPNGTWVGKHHSEESKQKIGEANSQHQQGDKNSQYGTCWITKDNLNKKIDKNDLEVYIEQGWIKGRKI